jgi:Glycosyl transferase family 2
VIPNHAAPPRVTVLMPAFNSAAYVDAAIRSILSQTFTDFELLIVDDGSTDGTREKVAAWTDHRIRVVRNESNIGLTRSLNRGLALARGAFVARHDADDVSHPERLARQVEHLDSHDAVAVVGAQVRYIGSDGRRIGAAPWPKSTSPLAIRWQLLFDSPFVHTAVMFRHAIVWGDLRGYDETFATSQDYELWSRMAAAGHQMRNLRDVLVDFRTHSTSVSASYSLEGIQKLHGVLLGNLVAQLGSSAVPRDWPDCWIRANNPSAFPDTPGLAGAVLNAAEAIRSRFAAAYPAAAGDAEIRRHLAATYLRVATLAAGNERSASLVPLARALRLDAPLTVRSLPRYAGAFAAGLVGAR